MALQNGSLDASLLSVIDSQGRKLEINAASAWQRVKSRVQSTYGWTPLLSPGATAYRTLQQQINLFNENYSTLYSEGDKNLAHAKTYQHKTYWRRPGKPSAATPGTSNHGLGAAVDVSGLGGFGSTRYNEFATIALSEGFTNTEGKSIDEPWHWVYKGKPATPTTPSNPAGDIMATLDEDDLNAIQMRVNAALISDIIRGPEYKGMINDLVNTRLVNDIVRGQEYQTIIANIVKANATATLTDAQVAAIAAAVPKLSDAEFAKIARIVNDDAAARRANWK